MKFWDKVHKCKHKRISENYLQLLGCSTPGCGGYESHCLACGVFISDCPCGCESGMSGWSYKRITKSRRGVARSTLDETLNPGTAHKGIKDGRNNGLALEKNRDAVMVAENFKEGV